MKKGLAFFVGKGRPLGKGKTNLKRFSRKESLRAEALFSSARWLRPGTFSFGRRRGRKTAAFAGIHAAFGAGARGAPHLGRQRTPPAFQGVEKGFSTPCKCKSAKAGLQLGHHFLVKWVSKIPHFTARAPSFSEAEGAATLRLPPETRDPPQRERGAIKKMIEEAAFCRTSQFALVVQGAASPCTPLLTGPSPAFIRHWRRRDAALGDVHAAACGFQMKG